MQRAATDDLVEREPELGQIDALIEDAAQGNGRLALIEGPAGIGKSRLLVAARERGAESMTVLTARAGELERDFPFGVVRQLFEPALADAQARKRALAGAAGPAAAVFGSLEEGDGAASFAALHGLFWLALNLAEDRPLLLAIDDLQWCDRASLRFVTYLVRRLEAVPVLVAATQRNTGPGTDPALLGEIAHDPLTVAIRPGPLSEAAVVEYVRARLGDGADEGFCRACHESTGGNPLLLHQLLRALEADGVSPLAENAGLVRDIGPRAVSRTVLLRLARLPEDAMAAAGAVAVLGDSADVSTVAALAGLDKERVADLTGELARAEILRPELPLGFVHPLVRDAVYGELPPGERELRHARAAALLRDAGAPRDEVAIQLLNAPRGGEAWVSELLHGAGRAALRGAAPDSAVAYLTRAIEEPPPAEQRPDLMLELGLAQALVNQQAAFEPLREAYETHPDPVMRAEAARHLVQMTMFTPFPEQGVELAREAMAELPPELDDVHRQLEAMAQTGVSFGTAQLEELRAHERYRDGKIPGDGLGTRMLQSMLSWLWSRDGFPAEDSVRLAKEALADGRLLEGDHTFTIMGAQLALVHADREEAMTSWDAIQESAHRRGSLFSALGVGGWMSLTLLRRGDLEEAERQVREALVNQNAWGSLEGPAAVYPFAWLAMILVERGDLAGCAEALGRIGPPTRIADGENFARQANVELLLARGEAEEALEAVEDFRLATGHLHNPAWAPWRSMKALALDRLGRTDEAVAVAEEELPPARAFGAPRTVGRALRVLGTVSRDVEILREAVAVLEPSPAKLEHAKALAALGAAIRRGRKPTDAREPLRQALELATVCGATPVAELARTELYASGARPRSDAVSGVESLTPSELRVAELASGGDSNREIAQTLYVTPKTVEVHLSSVYRKLGIRSRRELPLALG